MPLFLSSEEYGRCSHDASVVAEKADSFIRELMNQLETVKAQADAASITAEQACGILEHKYVSLSAEFSSLQSQHSQLNATLGDRLAELAQLREENRQFRLSSIGKDGENERLSTDSLELRKSKRQLMDILEQKDMEISEKNSTIKSYLDKIVNLTEKSSSKEARLSDLETQLVQSQASYARIAQEKEIVERHNSWLNDELKTKVNDLIELRRTHGELEAEMSAKVSDSEKRLNDNVSTLKWNRDRTAELESKLASLEQELIAAKDAAASSEKQFYSEISTLTKLVELYKESSEEWSKKAGELEGVIKALETQLSQVENDSKERLEKEVSARKEIEKEANGLKEKLDVCLAELESLRQTDELKLLPPRSYASELWMDSIETSDAAEDNQMVIRNFPVGVSGTAVAASLLRDGWSITKLYVKYQEAVDALRHEQLGRRQSETVLERVLHEIEQKADIILDERAELERTVESYSEIGQKLQDSLSEQTNLERQIQELEANIRRRDRENNMAQKEIVDLQNQVSVLLKECQDIQLRCGSISHDQSDSLMAVFAVPPQDVDDTEGVMPSLTLPFKDISGLVEQNVQLRHLVRSLSEDIVSQETSFKEKYERDLQKHMDEASAKVRAVLARAEEQQQMIESLHTSVAMYKKLFEEESNKLRPSRSLPEEPMTEDGGLDFPTVMDNSHESLHNSHEKAQERVKCLEQELSMSRSEIISVRSEADKLALEARLSQEKLERFMKEFDHQKDELDSVKARCDKLSQFIIDYQRKMRDSSESLTSAEEVSRNLTMEISRLQQEKEILRNSEKRASDKVRSLSERVHRLQASLDTIQSTEETREEARCAERRKQESYIEKIEREWAEAKKELHDERDLVRHLTFERENGMNNVFKQAEEAQKDLSKALRDLAAAEARAIVAEARCSDLEEKIKHAEVSEKNGKGGSSSTVNNETNAAKEEIAKLVKEAQMNKDHMLQYKSIAQANEEALKQFETAYEKSKAEADIVKKSLETDVVSLRETVHELQEKLDMISNEVAVATAGKEEAMASSLLEIASLRESCSVKGSEIAVLHTQITSLNDDLEKERKKSSAAQANYERQVILQSDTIQELNKTSQALAELQEETSELRRSTAALKIENNELKAKWETEKSMLEVLKTDADRKYDEVNELNKILHSRLEAVYIKLAENDRHSAGVYGSSSQSSLNEDEGLQSVVNYLRRSKDIAETENYLLKQEKFRLQSQLEAALKAAETAQASLDTERRNSKSLFFSEEEFTSLQLQVREISLLRESNVQLREESRQNFDECQKLREVCERLRIEIESLTKSLGEKQNEVEVSKKEIEIQMREKEDLIKKVDELLERSKNVDIQEYDRMKEAIQQLQVNLGEKDTLLEDFKSLLSERQDVILCLEAEVSRSKLEINEKESRVNDLSQTEASLRAEVRRLCFQQKKKLEVLGREKDDLSKENEVLSKQLEDFKQGKRTTAEGEQVIKEKEKEKDARIQILEKTVERLRDELKKEKDEHKTEKGRRGKMQKTVRDSYETVLQQRMKLSDELEKHKQGLKRLQDDVEKLKQGNDSPLEGSADTQVLSGTLLDDLSTAYHLAVENFQQATLPVSTKPVPNATESSPTLDATSARAPIGQVPSALGTGTSTSSFSAVNLPSATLVDDREKNVTAPKPNLESRKIARKLVRPRISKPDKSQVDVEMLEVERSDNSAKPLSSDNMETQGSLSTSAQPHGRKRPSSTSSELSEEMIVAEETAEPSVKKPKSCEDGEGLAAESNDGQEDSVEVLAVSEEYAANTEHSLKDSGVDAEHETISGGEKAKEEIESDKGDVGGSEDIAISQDSGESGNEREEGELGTEDADLGSPGPEMMLGAEDTEVGEEEDEKNDEGVVSEDAGATENVEQSGVESDKASEAKPEKQSTDTQVTASEANPEKQSTDTAASASASEATPEKQSTYTEVSASEATPEKQSTDTTASASASEATPEKQSTDTENQPTATTINLNERAKERASQRQAGMLANRGRGRAPRGRGRTSRGQSSSKQD